MRLEMFLDLLRYNLDSATQKADENRSKDAFNFAFYSGSKTAYSIILGEMPFYFPEMNPQKEPAERQSLEEFLKELREYVESKEEALSDDKNNLPDQQESHV